jgi:hypothetical protein
MVTEQQIKQANAMNAQGISWQMIASDLGVSTSTLLNAKVITTEHLIAKHTALLTKRLIALHRYQLITFTELPHLRIDKPLASCQNQQNFSLSSS